MPAMILALLIICPDHGSFAQNLVSFRDRHGNINYAELDPRTGSVGRILGLAAKIGDYGLTEGNLSELAVDGMATGLLTDYFGLLKLTRDELSLHKVDSDGEWWFAQYKQAVNGVPVYGTEIGFTIDPRGNVVTLGSSIYPHIDISVTPTIVAEEATLLAKQSFGDDSASIVGSPELVILPEDDGQNFKYHLSWKVELVSVRAIKHFIYLIDAQNGSVLRELNNMVDYTYYGTVTGSYWPVRATDQTVSAPFVTTSVELYDTRGALVNSTNTNSSGYYSMYVAAFAFYYVHFPLQNSWIKVRDHSDGDKVITHTVGSVPAQVDYAWPASDGTNVRRHADDIHTYYSGTFGYAGMNYQMAGYVNMGASINGLSDGTDIFFGSQAGQPWARSSDVVYHEYTHNTIYHVYGGWIGDPNQPGLEGTAMDEGLSDYYACTINNDPHQGEDVGVDRDLDNSLRYSDREGEAHYDGQIIGGACWDTRQTTSTQAADNLVFRSLQITPHARTFRDFLSNMYTADNSNYGGAYHAQILAAFARHGIVTIDVPELISWNMVSIPALVSNYSKASVYPMCNPNEIEVYQNGSYVSAPDPLSNGVGYFAKFPSAQSVRYVGYEMTSKAMSVNTDWNIIGSISYTVPTYAVIQNPSGIVISNYFKYESGYVVTTDLTPGGGYWVKVSQNGTLTLQASPPKAAANAPILAGLDKFTVTDNVGGKQEMYTRPILAAMSKGDGIDDVDIELPPDPPEGMFNVRFQTGNFVQSVDASGFGRELPIEVKQAVYPITIHWDIASTSNASYSIAIGPPEQRIPITNKGRLAIHNPTQRLGLVVEKRAVAADVPKTFTLYQNYPNPFNPGTTIRYALPADGYVTLKVFNILGENVATLVDEVQTGGYKAVTFDGGNLPSGMYVYQLQGTKYSEIRKMVLMK